MIEVTVQATIIDVLYVGIIVAGLAFIVHDVVRWWRSR